jgi:hypothetical protein
MSIPAQVGQRSTTMFFRWNPVGHNRGNGSLKNISHPLCQTPTNQDTKYR